ncbi:hypothetical protein CW679_10935 [Macrococcoides caseolyticum]|nr:hypothetical protein CW679_10935 [Macrococcus caseolyticus]
MEIFPQLIKIIGLLICGLFTFLAFSELKKDNESINKKKTYLYVFFVIIGLIIFISYRFF